MLFIQQVDQKNITHSKSNINATDRSFNPNTIFANKYVQVTDMRCAELNCCISVTIAIPLFVFRFAVLVGDVEYLASSSTTHASTAATSSTAASSSSVSASATTTSVLDQPLSLSTPYNVILQHALRTMHICVTQKKVSNNYTIS